MKLPFVSRAALEEAEARRTQLLSEFQNYKKRSAGAEDRARQTGCCDAFRELLPVYDNLLRALQQPCADEAFVQGIRMTMETLQHSMEKLGIEEIPAAGCPFDPAVHEAMDHIEDPSLGEGMVAEVVLTGFRRNGVILRHTLVIVAN